MERQTDPQNQESIKTLSPHEHIRLQPMMYIGRLGDGTDPNDGIYNFIKEIVANSIHEFRQGYGNSIEIVIKDNVASIRDYGRGIPLQHLVDAVSKIETGGIGSQSHIPTTMAYGLKTVNFLSSEFVARSVRDGKARTVCFNRGFLTSDLWESGVEEINGTFIQFRADEEIFGKYEYHHTILNLYLRQLVCINSGLEIKLNDKQYKSENGLLDLINDNCIEQSLYPPIHLRGENIEVVISHCRGVKNRIIYSCVNSKYTPRGGIHQQALCSAIAKTFSKFYNEKFLIADCCSSLCAAISIWVEEPCFYDSCRTQLAGDRKIIGKYVCKFIDTELINYLSKHSDVAQIIKQEILRIKASTNKIK